MSTRSIELPEYLDRFIDEAVRSGRGSDASGIVREGLELLERQEREDQAKTDWLRNAAQTAFDSIDRGEGTRLTSPEELRAFVRSIGQSARSRQE